MVLAPGRPPIVFTVASHSDMGQIQCASGADSGSETCAKTNCSHCSQTIEMIIATPHHDDGGSWSWESDICIAEMALGATMQLIMQLKIVMMTGYHATSDCQHWTQDDA